MSYLKKGMNGHDIEKILLRHGFTYRCGGSHKIFSKGGIVITVSHSNKQPVGVGTIAKIDKLLREAEKE